ncbi:PEP-CTERM sorting domain-containing protein [Singulisphaera acidiphila]
MVRALQSADPRSTPWVQYLLWRQGLNVARFNFYHPGLGPALEELPPPKTPPTTPPPAGGEVDPPTPKPPVPEPSSFLVALGMLGAGIWWRSRASRSPTRLTAT